MKKQSRFLLSAVASFALLSMGAFAAGPKTQVLHSFAGGTDGSGPRANVIADTAGNLYGTTSAGGSHNLCFGVTGCGVVFELSPPNTLGGSWKEAILYRFSGGADGSNPAAGLVEDVAGNLYGTTPYGGDENNQYCVTNIGKVGCGVVFELSPEQGGGWNETVIHTFEYVTDGGLPYGNLVLDSAGNLYGTTSIGGSDVECACGTVFELSPDGSGGWAENTIHTFQGTDGGGDGAGPLAGLTIDEVGNLYGTTNGGGLSDSGMVFELSPPSQQGGSWTENALFSFPVTAGQPRAGVIFDPEGNLYGTTNTKNGTVFELSESNGVWIETTIYSFIGGRFESLTGGLVLDNSGNLYGPKSGPACGAVYRLQNKNGQWNEAELDFKEGTTGPCDPTAALTFGKWGALYGTSGEGGKCSTGGCGTVFGILP